MYFLEKLDASVSGYRNIYFGMNLFGEEVGIVYKDNYLLDAGVSFSCRPGGLAILWKGSAVDVPELPPQVDIIDRLGDSFVIASRLLAARGMEEGDELSEREVNAWIVDEFGRIQRSLFLGNEFSHLSADRDGNIWVGYRDKPSWWRVPFEEGADGEDDRVSFLPGLLRWSAEGRVNWTLPSQGTSGEFFSCYALNSGPLGTVAALDHENLVVHVDVDGSTSMFPSTVIAPQGIAFDGEKFVFLGNYGLRRKRTSRVGFDLISVGIVKNGKIEIQDISRVVMPNGDPLPHFPQGVSCAGKSIMMNFGDPGVVFKLVL
ncbi:hypothetical protein NI17_009720 [Thermobifida halotolerans]|uniref:Uncharacterized protein n=1 Tax=Thermobifida halotolerans TaxID=483545 RepID=A0AA97M5N6_9ACTN|nr:hypothetical protein [Thermobifida halotolerans]UOE21368.1 hypothetical protein NI17_009720 [Thermobifida halotolerans]